MYIYIIYTFECTIYLTTQFNLTIQLNRRVRIARYIVALRSSERCSSRRVGCGVDDSIAARRIGLQRRIGLGRRIGLCRSIELSRRFELNRWIRNYIYVYSYLYIYIYRFLFCEIEHELNK